MNATVGYFVCCFLGGLLLAEPMLDDVVLPPEPRAGMVVVKTVGPEPVAGRLQSMSLGRGVVLRDERGEGLPLPAEDVVRLTTHRIAETRAVENSVITLSNGDVLYGAIREGDDEQLSVHTVDLGTIVLPLDAVGGIDMVRSFSPDHRKIVRWFNRQVLARQDRILLTNGDVVEGFVTAISGDGVAIDTEQGDTVISDRLVMALRLAFGAVALPEAPFAVVTLRRSGHVTVKDLTWKDDVIEAELQHGARVAFDADRVVRIDLVGGRWEWLSGHRPISYQHTPLLARTWDYVADRSVLGGPLRVANQTYDHGIGVHSRSSLTYDLKGSYSEFVTLFGIDDESGPMADVSVAVLVDGKLRFSQQNVRRGALHGPVRLDVKRANRIELVVDFGENGDLQDRFDWVEPALIR